MVGLALRRIRVQLAAILAVGVLLQLVLPLLSERVGLVVACSLICGAGFHASVRYFGARHAEHGRRRRAWMIGGCGGILLGVSYLCYTGFAVLGLDPPSPNVADLSSISAAAVALVALVVAAPRLPNRAAGLRRVIDVATVAGALFALTWQFVIMPAADDRPPSTQLVTVLSLAPELLGAALALVLVSGNVTHTDGHFLQVLAGGLGTFAVCAVLTVHNQASGLPWYATGAGAGYLIASLLMALAGHTSIPPEDTTGTRYISGAWMLFPYLPVVLAIGSIAALYVRTGTITPVLMWVLLSSAILVLLRQFITLFTTRQLLLDIEEQRRRLDLQAHRDSLTGLPNRAAFYRRAGAALSSAGAGQHTAVLMLDLDGFKPVNDTLGHAAGDEVLVHVAARLAQAVRAADLAARLGGDEFAVLLPSVAGPAEAQDVADRILRLLAEPMSVAGTLVHLGGSVGIALVTGPRDAVDPVLRDADGALYAAKSAGKGWPGRLRALPW